MATAITDEQRLELRKEERFHDLTRAAVANYAQYIHENDGTNPPGMSQVEWAKQRFFIAESILQFPMGQDNETWYSQFIMQCKGMAIWDGNVAATLNFMVANNTFEQLASQVFALRAQNVRYA